MTKCHLSSQPAVELSREKKPFYGQMIPEQSKILLLLKHVWRSFLTVIFCIFRMVLCS